MERNGSFLSPKSIKVNQWWDWAARDHLPTAEEFPNLSCHHEESWANRSDKTPLYSQHRFMFQIVHQKQLDAMTVARYDQWPSMLNFWRYHFLPVNHESAHPKDLIPKPPSRYCNMTTRRKDLHKKYDVVIVVIPVCTVAVWQNKRKTKKKFLPFFFPLSLMVFSWNFNGEILK